MGCNVLVCVRVLNTQNAIFRMPYEREHYASQLKIHRKIAIDLIIFFFFFSETWLFLHQFSLPKNQWQPSISTWNFNCFSCARKEFVVFEVPELGFNICPASESVWHEASTSTVNREMEVTLLLQEQKKKI